MRVASIKKEMVYFAKMTFDDPKKDLEIFWPKLFTTFIVMLSVLVLLTSMSSHCDIPTKKNCLIVVKAGKSIWC